MKKLYTTPKKTIFLKVFEERKQNSAKQSFLTIQGEKLDEKCKVFNGKV